MYQKTKYILLGVFVYMKINFDIHKKNWKQQKVCHISAAYRNDPKFSDRYAWANSTDPDQTAGAVWSGSTLFAISSASFGLITLW